MLIREKLEEREYCLLAERAAKSREARRAFKEAEDPLRLAFQRDRDRILHSKAFRRLKHKTQVYISPSDHYRTRLTHSLEVMQISQTIARALSLNEDLIEAIALGHDVGHTPFGHAGEYALQELIGHYHHNEQSLRVVEYLEKNGKGLNLTTVVKDGILHHTGLGEPLTLEGSIVKIGDRIAYLCHDYDDGIRAGMITAHDLPDKVAKYLGRDPSSMITAMVTDMIRASDDLVRIRMTSDMQVAMDEFRQFMFAKLYHSQALAAEREKARYIIGKLFDYYTAHSDKLPQEYVERQKKWGLQTTVVDYIAGLTDSYAIHLFSNLFIPTVFGVHY